MGTKSHSESVTLSLLLALTLGACSSASDQGRAPCESAEDCDTLCVGWSHGTGGECAPTCRDDLDCRPYEGCSLAFADRPTTRACVPSCAPDTLSEPNWSRSEVARLALLSSEHLCEGRAQHHCENVDLTQARCDACCYDRPTRARADACDTRCGDGHYCPGAGEDECAPRLPLGAACTLPVECASHNCSQERGVCLRAHGDVCSGDDCALCTQSPGNATFCHALVWNTLMFDVQCPQDTVRFPAFDSVTPRMCVDFFPDTDCPDGYPDACPTFCAPGYTAELVRYPGLGTVCVPTAAITLCGSVAEFECEL